MTRTQPSRRVSRVLGALSLSTSVLVTGCGAASTPATTTPVTATPARARLVVLVVYDQLASWVLERHRGSLDPEGAILRTATRGLHVERSQYPYAGTFTAPGHAAIVSGATPAESGIPSNRVWDRARHARISSLDDGVHPLLGREGAFGGPARLEAETVGDVLEAATEGRAHTVALGMKDRSAILPGGHHPDVCVWFDRGYGFTSSTYYGASLPAWVASFRETHPWDAPTEPWTPLDPEGYARDLGPDDRTGEGGYGWSATFPHVLDAQGDAEAFLLHPRSTELLLELAREAVIAEHLGEDETPDFLSVSVAATDYTGHAFGPESWEARDQLVRSDRAMGAFLAWLEARTDIAVVITADHGVAALVERANERGHEATRWSSEDELELLRTHLTSTLGARSDQYIEAWVQPYIYFTEEVRGDAALRARVAEAARTFLEARPGIYRAVRPEDRDTLLASSSEVDHLIARSLGANAPGELFVMPDEHSVASEDAPPGLGTAHGSPWLYDREVPVIVSGPGVAHEVVTEPRSQRRVAGHLAHLLGVRAPTFAEAVE